MLLGHWQGRKIGVRDDRHVMTLAGSRAGKTRSVLIPNLVDYPGPAFIIDPKGELAQTTAKAREKFGQVHVLDPFGASGLPCSSLNPFDELRRAEHMAADASQFADALIVSSPDGKDSHWTDSAKNLIKGLTLYLAVLRPQEASLPRLLNLLVQPPYELGAVFMEMRACDALDGALANIGTAFLGYATDIKDGQVMGFSNEMRSILSTAQQQTAPLNEVGVISRTSDFSLADIGRRNLTIYLVLPGMRLGTHFRWLRLILMLAFAAMERRENRIPREKLPAWFVLEEFAALGHVQAIETAAGYMAGYGVKLWAILQDLSQLKAHYSRSWETFLGNAGVIQAFGNVDMTTTKHLSEMLGQTIYTEKKSMPTTAQQRGQGDLGTRTDVRSAPLLAPDEVALHFARETRRQLVLVPGRNPIYLERMPDD